MSSITTFSTGSAHRKASQSVTLCVLTPLLKLIPVPPLLSGAAIYLHDVVVAAQLVPRVPPAKVSRVRIDAASAPDEREVSQVTELPMRVESAGSVIRVSPRSVASCRRSRPLTSVLP
ncbi:hypothetical protein HPB50_027043 [Hyalomma asiaticum]|uniref:Uncharacterized protein n=1 Tax=Hyalomma asiaticum TaxID=266040 RepID=A0ACB7RT42_HYAAI|nr:hypothetical protein HPB50_027043 [Hyalomma asiaticum]